MIKLHGFVDAIKKMHFFAFRAYYLEEMYLEPKME